MIRLSRSGASLLEVIISTAVFSLVVISVFTIYSYGQYKWKESVTNNSLQFTVRKAMIQMEQDLQMTNYYSVNWVSSASMGYPVTVNGTSYPRTAVCMAGVDNWTSPNSFSTLNDAPNWDVYTIYIATNETNVKEQMLGGFSYPTSGRFYRIVIFPTNSAFPSQYPDCANLASAIWGAGPGQAEDASWVAKEAALYESNGHPTYPRVTYMGTVDAFAINSQQKYVEVTFRSKEKANASESGARGASDYEGLQVDFLSQPQNTSP